MKTFSFVKSFIFSFVLLSAIIFSCDKKNIIEDDLNVCIESFSLLHSENQEKNLESDIDCQINAENYTISLTVPHTAVLDGLKFNITLCEGTTISPASGEEVNFEVVEESIEKEATTEGIAEESTKKPSPKRYKKVFTLTKGGKAQEYTVYITKALASDCSISSFKLEKSKNENKIFADREGKITETDGANTITLHVSESATLTELNPTIVHTGSISPGDPTTTETADSAGANITTITVNYTVTAADGKTTKVYAVKYIKDLSSDNKISAFSFIKDANGNVNTGLKLTRSSADIARSGDVVIDNTNGTIKVKASTAATITALTPTIIKHASATISPAIAAHDYSTNNNQVYAITAEDGQTREYTVSVDKSLSNAKEITSFTFKHSVNSDKNFSNTDYSAASIPAATGDDDVTVNIAKIPASIAVTGLKPTIAASPNATVNPADGEAQNFTRGTEKIYTVTAQDGTARKYKVTIPALDATAQITSFIIKQADHTSISPSITADMTITPTSSAGAHTIDIILDGDDQTTVNLSPEIVFTGSKVEPASKALTTFTYGTAQTYTVTAENGNTKQYSVTVKSSNSKMKSFKFKSSDGTNQSTGKIVKEVEGAINSNTVTVKVPNNAVLTNLTPEVLGNNGSTVTLKTGGELANTAQDFSSDKTYTVTAQDGTTSDYTVTVTKEDAPQLTSFKIGAKADNGIAAEVSGEITQPSGSSNGTIKLSLPKNNEHEITLTGLTPTIEPNADGYTVSPTSGTAVSESIEGKKITLTTTLGSTSEYTVTVVKGPFIKSFKFVKDTSGNSDKNLGSTDVDGAIDHAAGTIKLEVPKDVTMDSSGSANTVTLTPTIEVGGDTAAVDPASLTAQAFTPNGSTAVTYTVKNSTDTTFTKTYTVTVTKAS
ncbi:hypothetical protein [Ichthyobacterium seriolicida]|uniref:Pkd domain containing protein n=1 Tax=Ichthyobacterium seriolicida TaxID=242600 RepID=A0A1J1DXZ7_9FLAO|nr:hypothetical protein [Ichthyobacterium seriolicida]BAV94751.1 pkd domain containing protein [Ichthyobacterium seriolicida]